MGKKIENVNCSVCGLSSEQDKNFHKNDKLCNRHWLQIKRHGKPTDSNMINPLDYKHLKNCCDICGDIHHITEITEKELLQLLNETKVKYAV